MSATVSRAELALRFGMSKGTLANWASQGKGPQAHQGEGRYGKAYYLLSEVEAWERDNLRTLDNAKRGDRLTAAPILSLIDAFQMDHEYLPETQSVAIRKARHTGDMTMAMGDELAVSLLRMHPFEVWGDEWAAVAWFDMDQPEDNDTEPNAVAAVITFPLAAAA